MFVLSFVNFKAQVNENSLLRTQNVAEQNQEHFFVSRTQNLCPQQMLRARTNGETFVSATICPRLPGPIVLQTFSLKSSSQKTFLIPFRYD